MSPSAANTTRDASGESVGRTMPSALRGARESKSRLRLVYAAGVTVSVAENGIVCTLPPRSERLRIFPSDTYTNALSPTHEARNGNAFSSPVSGWPLMAN